MKELYPIQLETRKPIVSTSQDGLTKKIAAVMRLVSKQLCYTCILKVENYLVSRVKFFKRSNMATAKM